MILYLIICIQVLVQLTSAKYTIENSSISPDYAVIAVFKNCSSLNINAYFDLSKKNWQLDKDPSCSTSPKSALSFCQRAYPNLNVVNIIRIDKSVSFSVRWCDDETAVCRNVSPTEGAAVYKCLHGQYIPNNLYVPEKCSFETFFNQNQCQTDVEWTRHMNEKCKSGTSYLHDFRFLQWCDAAVGGFSSFVGVEFVCCNLAVSKSRELEVNEDDNIDYVNYDSIPDKSNSDSSKKPIVDDREARISQPSHNEPHSRGFLMTVGLVIILIICVVVIKRRKKRGDSLAVPVSVDCPEMNHVNAMQVNGYENPTYKYFERQN